MFQLEAQRLRIKRDRTLHVVDLVPNTVKVRVELPVGARRLRRPAAFRRRLRLLGHGDALLGCSSAVLIDDIEGHALVPREHSATVSDREAVTMPRVSAAGAGRRRST